ncbi:MAG: RNA polymerase sigma factor [Gemmataceae bacterium]
MNELDETLVMKAKRGDRAAFEELVRRTSRLVYARLYLETGDVHRSEDLVQETYLQAYRSIVQLQDASKLRAWLLQVAKSVLIDSTRRATRQKRASPSQTDPAALQSVAGSELSPADAAELAEQRQQVLTVLRDLPQEYQLPLTLRYITGADYKAIEQQLGLTNGALRGLLHRGLKLLHERLEPLFEYEEE